MHDIRPYLPELFREPGTLLYVGARPDACAWLDELAEAGHAITLLEKWYRNAHAFVGDARLVSVVWGDVRELDGLKALGSFNYVFWWHGPEHLRRKELRRTFSKLEAKARKLVALACPWGVYEQGPHEGNPSERHLCYLYPEDFEGWGYETATDGQPDEAGSEVVAWKRLA